MLLYHGSNLIVNEPRLLAGQRPLDFGAGFYTTTNMEQARDFAQKVVRRSFKQGLPAGDPVVSMYEFDEAVAIKSLKVLRFDATSPEWLEFVVQNRMGKYTGEQYDLVVGAVANDDVVPTIVTYMDGMLTFEACLAQLRIRKLYDQYVFKTAKALASLKYSGSLKL